MFTARYSPGLVAKLWTGWLAAALALTLGPLFSHVRYFARLGESAPHLLTVGLLAFACGAAAYSKIRTRSLRRWELRVLFGAVVAAAVLREPLATSVMAGFGLAALAAGALLLRWFGAEERGTPSAVALELALGVAALGMAWLALAAAGQFRGIFVALVAATALAAGARMLPARFRVLGRIQATWTTDPEIGSPAVGVTVFCLLPFSAFAAAAALAPAIQSDAIRQHLADSARILNTGTLFTSQAEWFSYFPKGFELWLAAAEALGGQAAAQLLNPLLFAASLVLLYGIVRECGVPRSGAALGTALGAVTPFVHWTGAVVKNDFLYALYHLAALYLWLRVKDQADRRPLVLGAFLMAASLGVKHTAVYGVLVISVMYVWTLRRNPRLIAACAAAALLFGTFWYARAYADTGSPLFPFGASTGGEKYNVQENFTEPRLFWLDTWKEYALYPWRAHFEGGLMFESPSENPSGVLLVLFSAGWLLFRRKRASRNEQALLLFGLAFYFLWGYVWGMLRYGIAAFLLLAALTAARIEPMLRSSSPWIRRSAFAALLYVFVFALPPTMMMEVNAPQLRYLAGLTDRETYLRTAVAGYPAMQKLAELWTPEALALSASNIAVAYAPDPTRMHYTSQAETYMRRAEEYLAEYEYDFLVYPRGQAADFATHLVPAGRFAPVYDDGQFTVARRVDEDAAATISTLSPGE